MPDNVGTNETGKVLNDCYTVDQYVSRRCWFLSKLPENAKMSRFFEGIREIEAAAVFTVEEEVLSVQEVRRREQAGLISPLLPLPTTDNTQTIDSFRSYSRKECAPVISPPSLRLQPLRQARTRSQPQPSTRSDQTATPDMADPRFPLDLTNDFPDFDISPVPSPSITDQPTLSLQHNPDVSSYSGRGVQQGVKTRTINQKGVDGSIKAGPLDTEDAEPSLKTTRPSTSKKQPPPKKRKLDNDGESKATIPAQPAPHIRFPPSHQAVPASRRARLEAEAHLEGVIDGTHLPRTPEEARTASDTRYERLLPLRSRSRHPRPDIPPEFHFAANYAVGLARDSVRCICGCTHDDGARMLACDECEAWQHEACLRKATSLPTDPEKDAYRCHVCDPFGHRVFLAGLRKKNPID